jgi:adenine-specific DNA-methyltransferase
MARGRRRAATAGPTPVEALVHDDTRVNIPTADAYDFVDEQAAQVETLRYSRDPSLDPQLVWKGKDAQDAIDLVVDAPPIFIQEKIDPRVLVENLRDTARAGQPEPEVTLFDNFDGLEDWQTVEFYRHAANWSNRMILGDSLHVMASLAEKENLRGQVQMIYIDPPYGIRFGSNWQVSIRKRDVKDGKVEDATREVEQIKAFRDTWEKSIHSYLSYLRDRFYVARELLVDSGSIFVQIGDENIHLVRAVLDEVFGSENFCGLIAYKTTAGLRSDFLASSKDWICWYGKERSSTKFRRLFSTKVRGEEGATQFNLIESPDGQEILPLSEIGARATALLEAGWRVLAHDNLTSTGFATTTAYDAEFEGRTYRLPQGNIRWKTTQEGLAKLRIAGRVMRVGDTLRYKRYLDDFPVFPLVDVWNDTGISGFGDKKLFVVQTNSRVIERCMLMTTDPGDLVLDPTCGSGTTAYVAEEWGRRWITIDTSRVATAIARQRILGARFPFYLLTDSPEGRIKEQEQSGQPKAPTATTNDIRKGFVYERVPHVTLKSIANNPDIREGMTRDEIRAAIARHAETEVLYDRPYEDKRKVRVAGPFTVESLSPHRAVSFDARRPGSEAQAEREATTAGFEQTILDNLLKAGVQNGRTAERLKFDRLSTYPGRLLQAEGVRAGAAEGTPERIAVSIGPQYGTVSPQWIKDAAREALHGQGFDLLLVCGFAFDARALETVEEFRPSDQSDFASVQAERRLGKLPVLLVRMNPDLAMGDGLLKKTGAGNLFTVFGEPDVTIQETANGLVVEIRGVDVYNPTTGEIRSSDPSEIAMWMIDTAYNEESFFVRHCYFTGGGVDPYARLKKALKAEIDEAAWASLYSTRSRPFPRPDSGRIAVKVINHYGDEVLQVYEV